MKGSYENFLTSKFSQTTVVYVFDVICALPKLVQLTGTQCRTSGYNNTCHFTFHTCGSCLIIKGTSNKGHLFNWCSSEVLLNAKGSRIFLDNLLFASNIVLSGNNYSKTICFVNSQIYPWFL